MNQNSDYVLEKSTNALIIPKITDEFVGNYTCKVEGATSSDKATSLVKMLRKYILSIPANPSLSIYGTR